MILDSKLKNQAKIDYRVFHFFLSDKKSRNIEETGYIV